MADTYWTLHKAPPSSPKKWAVRVPTSSGRGKTVLFGARGYEDFTTHGDVERRERYRIRHQHDRIDDPYAPGFWSMWALWGESDDLKTAFAAAVRKAKSALGQARRNPSPTKTLYRAAHDATVTTGTCFAEDIDDAIAYQDNPGFGGPNLYSLEVTPTYKTFVESLEDARDQIADAILKHGWPSDVRKPRYFDDEVDPTKEDLVAWLEDVFSGYESGHAHVHDVVADTPWVVDLLGQSYDWIVFKDSFPEDCVTWCYVGDDEDDLEDGMSLIDAQ